MRFRMHSVAVGCALGAIILAMIAPERAGAQINGPPPPQAGPGGKPLTPGELPPGTPSPDPPLTPAQQLVKDAGPTATGILIPQPPVLPDAPMPSSDPRDLRGTWVHNQPLEFRMARDLYGKLAPFTMASAKVMVRRIQSTAKGTPYLNLSAGCRPPGPQWQRDLNSPFSVFQTKDEVQLMFEEYHGRWSISLNADTPPPPGRFYMGRSVGHWEGNTLVVETTGFKAPLWLDVSGTPLSRDGKLITRIRKVDFGDRQPILEMITTIIDPLYYTNPWSVVRSYGWNPSVVVFREYNCEEQLGDPASGVNAGLIPEPTDQ